MRKKAQAWGFDLMVAVVIFLSGIIIFYIYSLNAPGQGKETIENLFFDGNFITDSLLSAGSPNDWSESNVISIGITDNNRINESKLETLYDFANPSSNPNGYQVTKSLFNTRFEYFFNFTETPITINDATVQGVGSYFSQTPKNLIKIQRITIYQNKPVTLDLYIWE